MVERVLDGRYALEMLVGSGGMADVYRAKDQLLERTVAVKSSSDASGARQRLPRALRIPTSSMSTMSVSPKGVTTSSWNMCRGVP